MAGDDARALATHEYQPGELSAALEFFKRTRSELRTLRKIRVWCDSLRLFDVNGDYFEICGIGYSDQDIVAILKSVNTVFKPEQIHEPTDLPYKEFKTGKRRPWAEDRVM